MGERDIQLVRDVRAATEELARFAGTDAAWISLTAALDETTLWAMLEDVQDELAAYRAAEGRE